MKKTKVIAPGAGLIGKPFVIDLAKDKNMAVSIADINQENLADISFSLHYSKEQINLLDKPKIKHLIASYDITGNAVPGFMSFQTLKIIIKSGKDCVDISFYPKNAFKLASLAKEKGIRIISDMGVTKHG